MSEFLLTVDQNNFFDHKACAKIIYVGIANMSGLQATVCVCVLFNIVLIARGLRNIPGPNDRGSLYNAYILLSTIVLVERGGVGN